MRLFVFARHGESVLNFERRINGDPSVDVQLTEEGRSQAHKLGVEIANIGVDLCVHTRFSRTKETAEIALAGREVPLVEEPLLDDIDVGDLEGETLEAYRAWKHSHAREVPFPGGESLDDAALRYAQSFRKLLALPHDTVLIITHEIPIRYALNGASGSDSLDGPAHEVENAVAYLFDDESLARAVDGIETILAG
ncbi:MAG TPA: histidine phosphatase family protein [Gaiellaceae bacterium]|nr:histidine phosphatase family protein [Gaiellaceae bacterium]